MTVLRKIRGGVRRIFASPSPQLQALDYEDYWHARGELETPARFGIIASMVPRGSRVADIGCGDGSLLFHLREKRQTQGWGADISSHAVELAQTNGLDCHVADATDPEFRLPESTDVVIISEVLEHIPDPESLLIRLGDKGVRDLIVTVPNTGYLEHRLRLLFGRFPVQWLFHPGEHLRFWTVADFRATAAATGYDVSAVRSAHGWFPFARIWPSLFGSQIVYRLARRDSV